MKKAKNYKPSLNLMIGLLIAMGFIFISFEWSKPEITYSVPVYNLDQDFIPEEQMPIVLLEKENVAKPIPHSNYEKLEVVDKILDLINDEPVFEDTPGYSDDVPDVPEVAAGDDDVFDNIPTLQVQPRFPGGEDAMYDFLNNNLKYPQIARELGISGRVYVQFVVEKDGSVSDIKIIRSRDRSLDKEALRIIELMPKWLPGVQNGHKVRVRMTLPVNFVLR